MLRSCRTVAAKLRGVRRDWVANYTHLGELRRFRSRSVGTSIAELGDGGWMPRLSTGSVLIAIMLCAACGRERAQPPRDAGAVGTSGRAADSVTSVVHAQ